LDRKVSVQLARKPDPAVEKVEKGESAVVSGGEGASGGEGGRRRPSGRGRGRGRGRGGRGGRSTGRGDHGAETANTEAVTPVPTTAPATPAPAATTTTEVLPLQDITNQTATDNSKDVKATYPRAQHQRRERGPPVDGIPSKNKVMVANLPYDLSEEKLMGLFAVYQPSSAKIALRPIPRFMVKKLQARNEPRKGRGFGFVTLASEELQQKAVAEMNGKEIEGREIAVKVAIDSPDKTDDDTNGHAAGDATQGTNGTTEATATV